MPDNTHSITTYVSDMLALERHIHVPFEAQLKDHEFTEYTAATELVSWFTEINEKHIKELGMLLGQLGGHEASPVKSAVSVIEGIVAGTIDKIRKTKVSKALRDDYTALALCTAGYTMLHATANAMERPDVADLSKRFLEDYAQCVMRIGLELPRVVVEELADLGLQVDATTVDASVDSTQQAWQSGGGTATATRNTTTRGSI